MWRWPVVAGKKDASAKAKAKVFSLHAKLIEIAAAWWADTHLNTALADAISLAKKEWVGADVIDRAIKRWAGIESNGERAEEIIYEWYGPGGVAIIIKTLTNNKNRTAPNIRHIFSAFGGNMADAGSLSKFMFDFWGNIRIEKPEDIDTFEMNILETSAQDYMIGDTHIEIKTDRSAFLKTKQQIETMGYTILSAELGYTPKNYQEITDFDTALKIYSLLEACNEDEDVELVWNNADIQDELWAEVAAFVESKKFRT